MISSESGVEKNKNEEKTCKLQENRVMIENTSCGNTLCVLCFWRNNHSALYNGNLEFQNKAGICLQLVIIVAGIVVDAVAMTATETVT